MGPNTHRKLRVADVERLSPVQCTLNIFIVLLNPLVHCCLLGHTDDVNDVHCNKLASVHTEPLSYFALTVVRRNQFICAMVRLASGYGFLAIERADG